MDRSLIHVLIVDDEESIRLNLEVFLEDEDFNIFSARTGKEALHIAGMNEIHVGIIDMRLPDTDGQTLILDLHEQSPSTRFLIHTGSIDYVVPAELKDIGVTEQNICHKPITDMDLLCETIVKLFQSRVC